MSTPATSARRICAMVAAASSVGVLVMVCTRDRRVAADRHLAHHDLAGLAAGDLLVGAIAHARGSRTVGRNMAARAALPKCRGAGALLRPGPGASVAEPGPGLPAFSRSAARSARRGAPLWLAPRPGVGLAIHQHLQPPGIAGGEQQPLPPRHRPALARPQHAVEQHRAALPGPHLHPGSARARSTTRASSGRGGVAGPRGQGRRAGVARGRGRRRDGRARTGHRSERRGGGRGWLGGAAPAPAPSLARRLLQARRGRWHRIHRRGCRCRTTGTRPI